MAALSHFYGTTPAALRACTVAEVEALVEWREEHIRAVERAQKGR